MTLFTAHPRRKGSITSGMQKACLILAAVCLSMGYIQIGLWAGAIWAAVMVMLRWLQPKDLRETWGNLVFIGLIGGTGYAAMNGAPTLWLLIATIASLSYWDLQAFHTRLHQVQESQATRQLEIEHMKRMAIVFLISLGSGAAVSLVRIKISLGVAMLLSLVTILSLRLGLWILQAGNQQENPETKR